MVYQLNSDWSSVYVTGQNYIQVEIFQTRLIPNFLCLQALIHEQLLRLALSKLSKTNKYLLNFFKMGKIKPEDYTVGKYICKICKEAGKKKKKNDKAQNPNLNKTFEKRM